MMEWNYIQPVELIFKSGGLDGLGEICARRGFQKGLLICDPFFEKNGLAKKLIHNSQGHIERVFSAVTPNPRVGEVDACAAILRETRADFAVALGGGSAMDCAKAACAIACSDRPASDYHSGGAPLPEKALPLIAVPTTAGTGSEVTAVAVLTDTDRGVKAPLGGRTLFPAIALIDPLLTLSVPPAVTAATGLDALSHALEGFWSIHHQPVCDALALHAARSIFEYLPLAMEDGSRLEAREKLCEASCMAGLAFVLPKTAAAHAISFPLTNIYGMPHGEACAFTLDRLCVINAQAENGRLNDFARQLGFADAKGMAYRIAEMKRSFGMKLTLADAGIAVKDIKKLAELCRHPNLDNNPVRLDEAALIRLFEDMQSGFSGQ